MGNENISTSNEGKKTLLKGYFDQESATKTVSYNIHAVQNKTCRVIRNFGLFENTSAFKFMLSPCGSKMFSLQLNLFTGGIIKIKNKVKVYFERCLTRSFWKYF